MQISTNTPCTCKTCGCKDVCEFYDIAVRPVIEITEETCWDSSDPHSIAYIKSLMTLLDNFICEYKE